MSTQRQKKLAKAIVENLASDKPKTSGELLENVGYSEHLVKQPGRIIEAEGVQSELIALGFSEDNAKLVVGEVLLNQEEDANARLKAADMIFKVNGTYAPEKSINLNANINAPITPKVKAVIGKFEDELFNTLANEKLS